MNRDRAESAGTTHSVRIGAPLQCIIAALAALIATGCGSDSSQSRERRPQQAGQPMSVVDTAANLAKARVGAVIGDQDMTRRAVQATADDMRRSMRLADPSRRVNPELARAAAKRVDGVRSVVWLDHANLFAIVEKNEHRSQRTIDDICLELEPLGDTLGVVVNLQSGAATNGDELEILARNCQLAPGERALLQRKRSVDVIDPEIRALHRANNGR